MFGVEPTQSKVPYPLCMRKGERSDDLSDIPNIDHKPFRPRSRHMPFSSPSGSSPHMGFTFLKTSSPTTLRMWVRESLSLSSNPGLEQRTRSPDSNSTYPVAKITTSACSSDPSSNFKPVSVKLWSRVPVLSLIFPSMISWLAPVSIERNKSDKYHVGRYGHIPR